MLKFRKKLAEKKEASKGIAKAGFTLIELLVVIAILAILVLLAAPKFLGYTKDANVRAMQADAKVLTNSALIYTVENEGWPVKVNEAGEEVAVAKITQGEEGEGQEVINVVAFDDTKLKDQVQSLQGEFSEYGIVTKGDKAGSVFRIGKVDKEKGLQIGTEHAFVEDKKGDKHFGVDLVDLKEDADDAVTVEKFTP